MQTQSFCKVVQHVDCYASNTGPLTIMPTTDVSVPVRDMPLVNTIVCLWWRICLLCTIIVQSNV